MSVNGCDYCMPVFIHSYFLHDGHFETTENATITFVKYNNRHYLVTCFHVVEAVKNKRKKTNDYWHTLSISLKNSFLQLSDIDHADPNKRKDVFRVIEASFAEQEIDIVIAPIESHWELITQYTTKKCIKPIDLDNWREPPWEKMNMGSAFGYPTEHKEKDNDLIKAPCVNTVAEIANYLSSTSEQLTLFSELEQPHGYYFSGMSGGPIFISGETDEVFPAGIVYEGQPSSSAAFESDYGESGSVFSNNQILIKGMVLTPRTFKNWLIKAGLNA